MAYLWGILVFLFGAAVGSFLNVCIHRIPRDESVVRPPSACPRCGHPIRFYDNIPLLSFFLLRGRCRDCQARISPRYPLVEGITGVLCLALFLQYGLTLRGGILFAFGAALIVATFIDLDHQIIPDAITLPGIPLGFLAAVFVLQMDYLDSLLGIVAGGGTLWLIASGYRLLTKRSGMGMGDVKLLAMIGAFLGWQSILFVLFASSFFGSLVGIAIIAVKKGDMKYAIPYGPFLSAAAVAYLFWGARFTGFLLPGMGS